MNQYRHYVSGFFANRADAERLRVELSALGLPIERIHLFEAEAATPTPAPPAGSNEVLKDIVVDGAIGTAVGTGVGALAQIALVAANVSLFVASPLIAPLAMLGWGASLGGLVGAAVGAGSKDGGFAALVGDAIANGQIVLVAETQSEQETGMARLAIQSATGDCTDRDGAVETDPSNKAIAGPLPHIAGKAPTKLTQTSAAAS